MLEDPVIKPPRPTINQKMHKHIHSGHWHKHKKKVIENDKGKCCFCKLEMTSPCEDMENFIRQLQVDLVRCSSSEVIYNSHSCRGVNVSMANRSVQVSVNCFAVVYKKMLSK